MWLENYIKNNLSYDLILRIPLQVKGMDIKSSVMDVFGKFEVSVSKIKSDSMIFFLNSLVSEISLGHKVYIDKKKGFSGQRFTKISSKINKEKTFQFLDFLINLIIKGLKRRFIVLKSSLSNTGVLNLRFSSFSELEIDDFFFFDIDSWEGFMNFFFNFSNKAHMSFIYSSYFLNVFNLKKLSKYEIFTSKG
jgi:hypothetical protein